jgi:4-amino-4-deoxychorismate lyase
MRLDRCVWRNRLRTGGGRGRAVLRYSDPVRVVAVLGRGRVPADTPILRADDLGVLRGDGVFETMHVRAGKPWLLDEHLARMVRSAAKLELDLPDRDALAGLVADACDGWPDEVEASLRLVCTRGPDGAAGPVTVFATVAPIGEAVRAARRHGIAVATATLGITANARAGAPWLLGGAKTTSYAMNMATQRWAYAHRLDDVLWVSADGFALEAPTSTLVWMQDGTLCTIPAADTGILAGTTVRWLLDHAPALGWSTAERMVRPAELLAADGVWLASSVRGAAPIRELDGVALPQSPHTRAIHDLLGHPV